MAVWLRTDEQLEAVGALETAAQTSVGVAGDVYHWRWVVLAVHNALQGLMVIALRGSDGLAPLRDDVAAEWLKAYRAGHVPPEEKLDRFLNLYAKIKGRRMRQYIHSEPFRPTGSQGWSVKKLNSLRNEFVHFLPRSWSLEVSGLPKICLDCVDLIEFLGWKCGNVHWNESSVEQRAVQAIQELRTELARLASDYGGAAA